MVYSGCLKHSRESNIALWSSYAEATKRYLSYSIRRTEVNENEVGTIYHT